MSSRIVRTFSRVRGSGLSAGRFDLADYSDGRLEEVYLQELGSGAQFSEVHIRRGLI
jgi:hypothetical protein